MTSSRLGAALCFGQFASDAVSKRRATATLHGCDWRQQGTRGGCGARRFLFCTGGHLSGGDIADYAEDWKRELCCTATVPAGLPLSIFV